MSTVLNPIPSGGGKRDLLWSMQPSVATIIEDNEWKALISKYSLLLIEQRDSNHPSAIAGVTVSPDLCYSLFNGMSASDRGVNVYLGGSAADTLSSYFYKKKNKTNEYYGGANSSTSYPCNVYGIK